MSELKSWWLRYALPGFPSRTNLKLHNISVTPEMVNKGHNKLWFIKGIWSWLYSSGGSKELWAWTFTLTNRTMCLRESCFPDWWKVSSVVSLFKNVRERSATKNYWPVSLLSLVSKVFEKLVNKRIFDHVEKRDLFSVFQSGFRPTR